MDYIYDLDEGTVRIMYARQDASRVFLPGGGNWNVAPDTVINIWVEVDFPVKKLRNSQSREIQVVQVIFASLCIVPIPYFST
jgi:hypothetical protein